MTVLVVVVVAQRWGKEDGQGDDPAGWVSMCSPERLLSWILVLLGLPLRGDCADTIYPLKLTYNLMFSLLLSFSLPRTLSLSEGSTATVESVR